MEGIIKITKGFYHTFMAFWFLFLILIALGNWTGKLRFGLGLGDFFYQILIISVLIIVGMFYIYNLNKSSLLIVSNYRFYLILGCLLYLIFIILKLTILRGPESSWDGRIFF